MEDEGVAARLAFDGNDFQATQVIGYDGDETIRRHPHRWFNGFAKLERMAMRKPSGTRGPESFHRVRLSPCRRTRAILSCSRTPRGLCRRVVEMFKWEEVTHKPPAHFKGHAEPYVELVKHPRGAAERHHR